MTSIPEHAKRASLPSDYIGRKRADSVQSAESTRYHYDDGEHVRRNSVGNPRYYSSLSPVQLQQGEIRRLSGNFNAPTHVELERHKDHKKSEKGGLRSAMKRLVKS